MTRRLTNEIVDIPLSGVMVKGILTADGGSWSFQSLNMEFLALFPGGVVYNHTYLDAGTLQCPHHRFQSAVAALVAEMLGTQQAALPKPKPRMSQPVHRGHSRTMMP